MSAVGIPVLSALERQPKAEGGEEVNNASRRLRHGAVMIGIAFGVLIGMSRLMVNAYSLSEAIAGCLLGAMVSTAFLGLMLAPTRPGLKMKSAQALPLLLLLLLPVFTAKPAPTERWLQSVAMALSGHDKVYSRGTTNGRNAFEFVMAALQASVRSWISRR